MEHRWEYEIGDLIPLDQAEKSDTFFLVIYNGKKYLVDQRGKVVLKQAASPALFLDGNPRLVADEAEAGRGIEWLMLDNPPKAEPLKFRFKPGTPEFVQAVQEAESVLLSFVDLVSRYYLGLAPRFEAYLENTRTPYVKYFERGKDGLANTKAYLIGEFFIRTTRSERGLGILEFLTAFISRRMNGAFSRDQKYSSPEQRALLSGFLDFVGGLGDTPARRSIIASACRDLIAFESELLNRAGEPGRYLELSLQNALRSQQESLPAAENRHDLDKAGGNLVGTRLDFFLDNMLAYVKGLAILRLLESSGKKELGRGVDEWLIYAIIAYHPSWYG